MIEIPESKTLGLQADKNLAGKRITEVVPPTSPHKYAFFCGDPGEYPGLLRGKQIMSAEGHGMFVDIHCDENVCITIGDGTNIRLYEPSKERPAKHQLLLEFDDGSFVVFTVAMYGGIWAYSGILDNSYHQGSLKSISPFEDHFDEFYFDNIFNSTLKNLSVKALLATEQRIPGLGNGVLQDILFHAHIHPRRKKATFSDSEKADLFHSLKSTLKKMADMGGRDTERDLFGHFGGYPALLSKKTVNKPCSVCGDLIKKEAYLGGSVYFCPTCQPL